jgi:transposase-like protein
MLEVRYCPHCGRRLYERKRSGPWGNLRYFCETCKATWAVTQPDQGGAPSMLFQEPRHG